MSYIMGMIPIVPSEMIVVTMLTGFNYEIMEFIPNTSAKLRVIIYSENVPKKIETVILEGQAYADWGNNDDYLTQYVATTLGFTLA